MTAVIGRRIPPQRLINMVNPVVRGILQSPLHRVFDSALVVLHVIGRRTGSRYDIPVGFLDIDGQLVVITQHGWRVNIRGGADIEVTHCGRRARMHGELTEDPAAVAIALHRMIQRVGWKAARRQFGLSAEAGRMPTVADLQAAAAEFNLAIVTLSSVTADDVAHKPSAIQPIRLGGVNCYLIKTESGFILIDTGTPEKRTSLDAQLAALGCGAGSLRLIVLTHGDYDHAGNAAHLRARYGAKIALHPDDVGRVERADWSWNLKPKPDRFQWPFRIVAFFIRAGEFETFRPDVLLHDRQHLSEYGLDATVLHLGGHTRGSIGILTAQNDLFCGDLFDSIGRPGLEFFIDDLPTANASAEMLGKSAVKWVYPGHGRPFRFDRIVRRRQTTTA